MHLAQFRFIYKILRNKHQIFLFKFENHEVKASYAKKPKGWNDGDLQQQINVPQNTRKSFWKGWFLFRGENFMSKYREIRKMHVRETEWKRKMRERERFEIFSREIKAVNPSDK